jgi:hypothetical protein
MKRSIWILAGAAPLWLAGSAWGQSTSTGAAELRDGLNEMLKPILAIQVQQQPLFTGPVTVAPAANGYTVVFPGIDLTLKGSEAAGKPVVLHCDAQTYSAVSAGTAAWRLESSQAVGCVATPEGEARITATSRALQARFTVDLQQKLFTEAEWRLDDVAIAQDGKTGKVGVDTLSASSQLRPSSDPARHDLAFKMEASGISALDETGIERFSLGRAAYDGTMDGMDVQKVMASYSQMIDIYVEMFQAMAAAGVSPADPKQASAMQAEVMKKIMGPLKEMVSAYGDGGQFGATMTDLRVKAPEVQVTLDRVRVVEGYGGATTPSSGTGVVEMELGGLAIAPKPPFAEWIPTDATIRLNASGIPWAEVCTAYLGVMQASAEQAADPAKAQQAMAQSMMQLGGILRKAGAKLDVTSFRFTAPEAVVDLKGTVQGRDSAAHGVNADLALRFTNLDGLIKFIQSLPDGAQAAAGLTMAQVMGRQATADDGRPARDYDIVIDDAGKILVNGTDLAALAPK